MAIKDTTFNKLSQVDLNGSAKMKKKWCEEIFTGKHWGQGNIGVSPHFA